MKKTVICLLSVSLMFILTSCPDAADTSVSMYLKNNLEDEDLLFVFNMGYDSFCPDTLLPIEKYGDLVKRGKTELVYSDMPDCSIFYVLILSMDTVNKYSWEQIREDYNILKRYDIEGKRGLKNIDYTITYP